MKSQEILNDINETYSEYLEMMSIEEKFIIITQTLAQKLALEMAEKDHYKTCFEASINNRMRS
mgnify:CR=1 FL=1